jgi:hypothetical protein
MVTPGNHSALVTRAFGIIDCVLYCHSENPYHRLGQFRALDFCSLGEDVSNFWLEL